MSGKPRREVIQEFVPGSPFARELGLRTQRVDVAARASVVRRGRSLCFVDVDIVDPDGEVVAKGLVTYRFG